VSASLGKSKPLLLLFISRMALLLGVLVPMPTLCAVIKLLMNNSERKKVVISFQMILSGIKTENLISGKQWRNRGRYIVLLKTRNVYSKLAKG
jgi:hypothetical protein